MCIRDRFMYEFLDTPVYARWNIKVHYSKLTGEWKVEGKTYDLSLLHILPLLVISAITPPGLSLSKDFAKNRLFSYLGGADDEQKSEVNLNQS